MQIFVTLECGNPVTLTSPSSQLAGACEATSLQVNYVDIARWDAAGPGPVGKWFASDAPNVHADDADLMTLPNAIGCTPGQVAQEVTAQ